MKSHSLFNKFPLLVHIILLILLLASFQYYAQVRSKTELTQAALHAFAGDVPGKKAGPLSKAGFDLALLSEEFKDYSGTHASAPFKQSNDMLFVSNNKVVVDIIAKSNSSALELINLGMEVTGKAGAIISGYLPITSIESVAASTNVRFLRPSMCQTRSGLTTSQGDESMHSNSVRASLGFDGSGVTVGVLSDSYNCLKTADADIASGDLPGTGNPEGHTTPVNIIEDDTTSGNTDEGRAMLQIVHDVAPGANLAFATAFSGQAGFANNITALRTTAGANVIVDDVIYFAEPMFQDGVIAQAVDAAVAAGVSYFSAAGNQGRNSYESAWRSGPLVNVGFGPEPTFDFDPGPGTDYLQSFTLGSGQTVTIILQWDSPFASACTTCPGSQNDIDIYLLNATGSKILAGSQYDNIDGDAVEGFQYKNTSGSTATYNLMICKFSGDDPGFIKYINFGSSQGNLEYPTNSSTLFGHANANGAEAVGASYYFNTPAFGVNPPVLNYYSSYGPTSVLFATDGTRLSTPDPRSEKPEVTAPDGVNTTFFGSDYDGDTYPNFFGTSAAAPHAAAVAALMLQADNSLTPAQIYSNLESSALDMGPSGFDNGSGYGLIQADLAVPLPVELVSFNAEINGSETKLIWTTSTEVNNYGFGIERKSQNSEWVTVGFVKGNGNSNSTKNYFFIDNNVNSSGKYSYRLKQIDLDGKFEYSNEIEVNFGLPNNYSLNQNYPNPFNPSTVIKYELPEAAFVTLKIYDVLGREVKKLVGELKPAGKYEVKFNGQNLPSGIYFYQLTAGNFVSIKKMILTK